MAAEGTGVSGLAARYATALFELADEQRALDQTEQDLTSLKQVLDESAELQRMVRNPLLSRAEQGRAMAAILDQMGVSDTVKRFVGLMAVNRRLFVLRQAIDGFLAELAHRRGESTAHVVAARPLSDAQVEAVTEALRKSFGSKVGVAVTVDPSLIGGMIVKVGSRMIDSSVRTKLDKLQLAMKGVG
ncbi:MAG TPA: F0F1 ATP synthase subunit delta [Azospirillaceae bacterium]|nr:F0F1 ATP synthase subunit delta [Azospirillaceae bacterium]